METSTIDNVLKSIQKNKYNRSKDIKDFIEALELIEGNMFISIDANWGSGKTFYVRQIEQTLNYLTRKSKGLSTVNIEPYFAENSILNSLKINFPGASTQMPQGHLLPAMQERGIRPNLTTFGTSLHDAEHRGIKPSLD